MDSQAPTGLVLRPHLVQADCSEHPDHDHLPHGAVDIPQSARPPTRRPRQPDSATPALAANTDCGEHIQARLEAGRLRRNGGFRSAGSGYLAWPQPSLALREDLDALLVGPPSAESGLLSAPRGSRIPGLGLQGLGGTGEPLSRRRADPSSAGRRGRRTQAEGVTRSRARRLDAAASASAAASPDWTSGRRNPGGTSSSSKPLTTKRRVHDGPLERRRPPTVWDDGGVQSASREPLPARGGLTSAEECRSVRLPSLHALGILGRRLSRKPGKTRPCPGRARPPVTGSGDRAGIPTMPTHARGALVRVLERGDEITGGVQETRSLRLTAQGGGELDGFWLDVAESAGVRGHHRDGFGSWARAPRPQATHRSGVEGRDGEGSRVGTSTDLGLGKVERSGRCTMYHISQPVLPRNSWTGSHVASPVSTLAEEIYRLPRCCENPSCSLHSTVSDVSEHISPGGGRSGRNVVGLDRGGA
ncbi:malate dehydrogenase [Marssonina coronariae]|uniref:Malate dehydrogenase n=1 Tax=Diplocarpon coronariae TaxID=2795749 RepID=A0A218YTQ9_9HELO|nr:malate dehydrogenase [Marssonina coronariae]